MNKTVQALLLSLMTCLTAYADCANGGKIPGALVVCSDSLDTKIDPITRKATLSHIPSGSGPVRLFSQDHEEPGADFTISGSVMTLGPSLIAKRKLVVEYETVVGQSQVPEAVPETLRSTHSEIPRAIVLASLTREQAAFEGRQAGGPTRLPLTTTRRGSQNEGAPRLAARSLYLLETYARDNQLEYDKAGSRILRTERGLYAQGVDGLGDGVLTRICHHLCGRHPGEVRTEEGLPSTGPAGAPRPGVRGNARSTWMLADRRDATSSEGAPQ